MRSGSRGGFKAAPKAAGFVKKSGRLHTAIFRLSYAKIQANIDINEFIHNLSTWRTHMSHHDKKLIDAAKAKRPSHLRVRVLRGIRDLTLQPTQPQIKFGSLRDDVRAISLDMRRSIDELTHCD